MITTAAAIQASDHAAAAAVGDVGEAGETTRHSRFPFSADDSVTRSRMNTMCLQVGALAMLLRRRGASELIAGKRNPLNGSDGDSNPRPPAWQVTLRGGRPESRESGFSSPRPVC